MQTITNNVNKMGRLAKMLAGAAVVAGALIPAAATEAQFRLNSFINNVNSVNGGFALRDDNRILYQGAYNPGNGQLTYQVWQSDKNYLYPYPTTPWGAAPLSWDLVKNHGWAFNTSMGKLVYDKTRQTVYFHCSVGYIGSLVWGGPANPKWVQGAVWAWSGNAVGDPALEESSGCLYYRGKDNNLWICGGGIYGNDGARVTYSGNMAGNPVYDKFASTATIYYRGNDNRLWRAIWLNGKWQTQMCGNFQNLTSDPAVNRTDSVVFRDTYGKIASTWFQYGQWNTAQWGPANNVVGSPVVGTWDGVVFYKGADSRLWICYWDGKGFTSAQAAALPNVAGDIIVNSVGRVFYRGTDNSIWSNNQ